MNSFVLIYPEDPTTRFLMPIAQNLKELLQDKLVILEPKIGTDFSNEHVMDRLLTIEDSETVIFMGHGSKLNLHGATNDENIQNELCNISDADIALNGKNFICLSCWSFYFVHGLDKIKSSISFGNLPTAWKDVLEARSVSKNAYKDYTEKSIEIYQRELVKAFSFGLVRSISTVQTLSMKDMFFYIKLFINKAISQLLKIGDDPDNLLAARQLYILKLDMKLLEK